MRSEVRILSGAMLLEVFCCGPASTNAILLACPITKQGAIVDAPFGCSDEIINTAKDWGVEIRMLLLTHSHWDHFADAANLKKKLNIPVYIHEEDAYNIIDPGADGLPMFFDIEKVEPDFFLKDKEQIPLGKFFIEVIHTPGHTPGGVCFYIKSEAILISGDTIFHGNIGNLSFPTSDPEKMWHSLDKLAKLPSETKVFPGHGPATTIGKEKWLPNARSYFGG